MGELKWRSPVPLQGQIESERLYLRRLATWLNEQERDKDFDLEASLAFGGLGVAERMFGFEGLITGYTPPSDTHPLLQGPTGTRKFIIIGLHVAIAGVGVFDVVKRKVSTDSLLVRVDDTVVDHEEVVGRHKTGFIVLDAANEGIRIKTVSGTADISFSGSYLDVD